MKNEELYIPYDVDSSTQPRTMEMSLLSERIFASTFVSVGRMATTPPDMWRFRVPLPEVAQNVHLYRR